MTDHFLTRDWAEQQHRFSDSVITALGQAWRTLRVSLDRLNAYEFDAPWRDQPARRRSQPPLA